MNTDSTSTLIRENIIFDMVPTISCPSLGSKRKHKGSSEIGPACHRRIPCPPPGFIIDATLRRTEGVDGIDSISEESDENELDEEGLTDADSCKKRRKIFREEESPHGDCEDSSGSKKGKIPGRDFPACWSKGSQIRVWQDSRQTWRKGVVLSGRPRAGRWSVCYSDAVHSEELSVMSVVSSFLFFDM